MKREQQSRRDFLAGLATLGVAAITGKNISQGLTRDSTAHAISRSLGREYQTKSPYVIEQRQIKEQQRQKQEGILERLDQKLDEVDAKAKSNQINRERREQRERQKHIQDEARRYEHEKTNPGSIPLGQGSDQLEFARALYCEGREFWRSEDDLDYFASVILTRQELSEASIREIVYDGRFRDSGRFTHQFSCFNDGNYNFPFAEDPLVNADKHKDDKRAWERIYDKAGEALKTGRPKHKVDHYWTDVVGKPKWAKESRLQGTVDSTDGRKTRFYNLGHYERQTLSPLVTNATEKGVEV